MCPPLCARRRDIDVGDTHLLGPLRCRRSHARTETTPVSACSRRPFRLVQAEAGSRAAGTHHRITTRRTELDELEEQLAKQLAEVRAERDELAIAERVLERVTEQLADDRTSAAPMPGQAGGQAVTLIPHRAPGVEEAALAPGYQRLLAVGRTPVEHGFATSRTGGSSPNSAPPLPEPPTSGWRHRAQRRAGREGWLISPAVARYRTPARCGRVCRGWTRSGSPGPLRRRRRARSRRPRALRRRRPRRPADR